MNAKHSHQGLLFGIPGFLLQTGSQVVMWKLTFSSSSPFWTSLSHLSRIYLALEAVSLAGLVLLIVGLRYYAKAKGYSAAFGLLGFLGVIGIFIMVVLPDKNRG